MTPNDDDIDKRHKRTFKSSKGVHAKKRFPEELDSEPCLPRSPNKRGKGDLNESVGRETIEGMPSTRHVVNATQNNSSHNNHALRNGKLIAWIS